MPIHRVSRATLHDDLLDIERKQREKVMSICPDANDSAFYIVVTEFPDAVETRVAS